MNKLILKAIDKLMLTSENKLSLIALEKIFTKFIPFNSPHKFKFIKITDAQTRIFLPHKRINTNHLGGMHACAIATLGEIPAGVSLLKRFKSSKYRIIMSHLEAEYVKQGRTDLIGTVEISPAELDRIQGELNTHQRSEVVITTRVEDKTGELVCFVKTNWQLKDWNDVGSGKKKYL